MAVFRKAMACLMSGLMLVPAYAFSADTKAAMVYARGTAWINGVGIPRSSAIFAGDMVQTRPDSVANINTQGSNIAVFSDSLVRFEGNGVQVEHGGVRVTTSKGLTTRAGEVQISPTSAAPTEFQVTDVDGRVKILASKGDLNISDASGTSTLPAGQETTRDETQESGRRRRRPAGAATAAEGGLLDSKALIYGAAGAAAGVTLWVLLQGDEPVSPDH